MINNKKCEVAILAGGFGTRLREKTGVQPKAMVLVRGEPLLLHQIRLCRSHGFNRIALLVYYQHHAISDYFGDGSSFGVSIKYIIEETPRGTAGALKDALDFLDNRFIVLYGDTFLDVDLRRMYLDHIAMEAQATLFLHPNDHPQDSDLIDVDNVHRVVKVYPYPHPSEILTRNLVNAALYVFDKNTFSQAVPEGIASDIAKHVFPRMLSDGAYLHGYISPEYIKDVGTPYRLEKVERDIEKGVPELRSGRTLRPSIFLDRDGCINVEVNHLRKPSELKLIESSASAIARINQSGYLAVVVTNQPVLARGELTEEGLDSVHAHLERLLGQEGAFLDKIYICPHHPDKGYLGEVDRLKVKCKCRKPQAGLIDLAVRDLNIDRKMSWMIGDSTTDIEAGQRGGLRTILIRTGYAGTDGRSSFKPEYICSNLNSAIEWILHDHSAVARIVAELLGAALKARFILIGGLSRTGKSHFSQVLKEACESSGRRSHVVSIDSWLRPPVERKEGSGVLSRYDLAQATSSLLPVVTSSMRSILNVPEFDRATGSPLGGRQLSVGANDLIVLEGVTALCVDEKLIECASLRIYLDANDSVRFERLHAEYKWRGKSKQEIEAIINSRELDEVPLIRESRKLSNLVVSMELNNDC